MRVEPVRALTLEQSVYQRIKEMIVSLQLRPGSSLNISALAATLEVSITPVRAGLQMLEKENLVLRVPNVGFSVAPLTRLDAHYVYEMRRALEVLALERAIVVIDHGRLRALAQDMEASKTRLGDRQERSRPFAIDYSLHDLIIESCENPYLQSTYVGLMANIQRYRNLIREVALEDDEAWIESELEEHIQIIGYLLSGDLANASETMYRHINRLIEVVEKMLTDLNLDSGINQGAGQGSASGSLAASGIFAAHTISGTGPKGSI